MLSIKELQALIELLNKKEQTLERIQELFLSKFKDSDGVFRASYALSNLINLNVCVIRIPAIFLLIANYKTEGGPGITHHPFGATIFELVQSTKEPLEKRMIYDMIIDSARQKYSRLTVQQLDQQEQQMFIGMEERPEIRKLKEQFLANLPKISHKSQSDVKNVIKDSIDKERQQQIPEYHINLSTIKQSQIDIELYNVGFQRPMPKFIQVDPSQFHWLSPSIYSQIKWDSTSEINIKISKGKNLMKKALDQHLTKEQSTEIERILQSDPSIVLLLQATPQMLNQLIKINSFIAVAYLVRLSNFPIFDSYLEALISCEVSINSIDVCSRIIKTVKTPLQFSAKYTNQILRKILEMDEQDKDRLKLARIVINFIKSIKKSKPTGMPEIQQNLDKFIKQFIAIEQVQQYKKLVNKE